MHLASDDVEILKAHALYSLAKFASALSQLITRIGFSHPANSGFDRVVDLFLLHAMVKYLL